MTGRRSDWRLTTESPTATNWSPNYRRSRTRASCARNYPTTRRRNCLMNDEEEDGDEGDGIELEDEDDD